VPSPNCAAPPNSVFRYLGVFFFGFPPFRISVSFYFPPENLTGFEVGDDLLVSPEFPFSFSRRPIPSSYVRLPRHARERFPPIGWRLLPPMPSFDKVHPSPQEVAAFLNKAGASRLIWSSVICTPPPIATSCAKPFFLVHSVRTLSLLRPSLGVLAIS